MKRTSEGRQDRRPYKKVISTIHTRTLTSHIKMYVQRQDDDRFE